MISKQDISKKIIQIDRQIDDLHQEYKKYNSNLYSLYTDHIGNFANDYDAVVCDMELVGLRMEHDSDPLRQQLMTEKVVLLLIQDDIVKSGDKIHPEKLVRKLRNANKWLKSKFNYFYHTANRNTGWSQIRAGLAEYNVNLLDYSGAFNHAKLIQQSVFNNNYPRKR